MVVASENRVRNRISKLERNFFFREGGKNRILGYPNCFINTSYFIFVDVDFTGL